MTKLSSFEKQSGNLYVPPMVIVIEINSQSVMCASEDMGFDPYFDGGEY